MFLFGCEEFFHQFGNWHEKIGLEDKDNFKQSYFDNQSWYFWWNKKSISIIKQDGRIGLKIWLDGRSPCLSAGWQDLSIFWRDWAPPSIPPPPDKGKRGNCWKKACKIGKLWNFLLRTNEHKWTVNKIKYLKSPTIKFLIFSSEVSLIGQEF